MQYINSMRHKTFRGGILVALAFTAGLAFSTDGYAFSARNAPNSTDLTCNQIRGNLRSRGEIFLRTPKSKGVSRYVNNAIYCNVNRSMRYTSVKSKDKQYCRLTMCSGSDMLNDHSRGRHHGRHHGHHGRGRY